MTSSVLEIVVPWLVRASWQAAVLGLIVLLVSRAVRDRLEARWRFCLWLVVLTRLAIPVTPTTPWSLFRLAPATSETSVALKPEKIAEETATGGRDLADVSPVPLVQPPAAETTTAPNRIASDNSGVAAEAKTEPPPPTVPSLPTRCESNDAFGTARHWLTLGWLLGLLTLFARQGWLQVKLRQRLRTWHEISNPLVQDVFRRSCDELRICRRVNLLMTPDDFGPATYGAFRPSIMLPEKLLAILSRVELRLVLLHELIHIRRRDVLLDRVAFALVAIHWFNPVAWLALASMRRERELACDAAVLRHLGELGELEFGQYGHALLKVAEHQSAIFLLPGAVGVFGKNQTLVRRIHMIAKFKKPSPAGKVLGWLAVFGLAAIGLTDAVAQAPGDKGKDQVPPAATKHEKARTISIAGVCRDLDGKPVAGARVMLYRDDDLESKVERLRTVVTGDDGRFDLRDLPPLPEDREGATWTYALAISKKGRGSIIQSLIAESLKNPIEFTLRPAATLKGRVTNADGKPVAGAKVCDHGLHIDGIRSATTDADGHYAIVDMAAWGPEALKPRPSADNPKLFTVVVGCYFNVLHPDYAQNVPMYRKMPDTVDVVLQPGGIIEGKVVDQVTGKPATGSRVCMQGINANAEGGSGQTRTDRDGKYRITSVAAGQYNLWAEAPNRTGAALDSFAVEAGKTRSAPDLMLVEGGWLEGRLVEAGTGKPIIGNVKERQLLVGLYGPSRPKSGACCQACPVDDHGHFRLRVAPGTNFPYIMQQDYWQRTQRRDYFEKGVDVKSGEAVNVVFHILPTTPIPGAEPVPVRLPIPIQVERQAAAKVRQFGGWYTVDMDDHVVEVNMVYHETLSGQRFENDMTETDEALRAVGSFPRLKRLYLTKGQATDDGLRALTGLSDLEELMVWEADRITDAGIDHLAGLTKLRDVHFSNGKIGDDALAVFSRLPAIRSLSLQGNSIGDDGLKHLAGLKQLRSLWIGMSRRIITDAGVKHLAGLTALESLDLQQAQLSNAGVAALKDLKQLRRLHLAGANGAATVTDASVEHLLGFTKLNFLRIQNGRLTEEGTLRLTALPELRSLVLTISSDDAERLRKKIAEKRPSLELYLSGPPPKE